jgi:hypothetical protein
MSKRKSCASVQTFTEIEKNCGENVMNSAIHSVIIGTGQLVLTQAGSIKTGVEHCDITALLC